MPVNTPAPAVSTAPLSPASTAPLPPAATPRPPPGEPTSRPVCMVVAPYTRFCVGCHNHTYGEWLGQALPGTLGVSLGVRRPILSPSQIRGSYLRPTTRSFIGMIALSVILMCSGHTSVQHLVMLQ